MNALELISGDGPHAAVADFYLHPTCSKCGKDIHAPGPRNIPLIPWCRKCVPSPVPNEKYRQKYGLADLERVLQDT